MLRKGGKHANLGADTSIEAAKVKFLIGGVDAIIVEAKTYQEGINTQLRLDASYGRNTSSAANHHGRIVIRTPKSLTSGVEPR
jgi:hypothetical protein